MVLEGWFADFDRREFFHGRMCVEQGRIESIREGKVRRKTWEQRHEIGSVLLPGLVDAHVHIESSMLLPSRFAAMAVRYGTVATVSDPHEIANVMGIEGIRFLMEDARQAAARIFFTAPSCVPATRFETSGATLRANDLEELLQDRRVVALGEVMNYPGVIGREKETMDKIKMAEVHGWPVDGHAPGLVGEPLRQYVSAGISTDHECLSLEEAREKISLGMKVMMRWGSFAKNFESLWPLIDESPGMVMLCTDDLHPDDLTHGHIDRIIRAGLENGLDFFNLYRAASLNAVEHYRLGTGTLKPGDPADFIVGRLAPFRVESTYVNGCLVFGEEAKSQILPSIGKINVFRTNILKTEDLEVRGNSGKFRVIQAFDEELVTGSLVMEMDALEGTIQPDTDRDVLKIAVVNRYRNQPPAIGWINGFGLKRGAMASSISHDSHNIIGVGTNDVDLANAINAIIKVGGGLSVCGQGVPEILELPVAGLLSTGTAEEVGQRYHSICQHAMRLGTNMKAPFMTLSFMALLVIPHLKLSDLGLFDCDRFQFTDLKCG